MRKKRAIFFSLGILSTIFILEGGIRFASPLLGPPLASWNTMEDAKKFKLEEVKRDFSNPDYIFMGNSTTLIGVNPSILNSKSGKENMYTFNAGMNGADIKTMRDFACSYLIKNIKPKNLVLLFSNSGMIRSIDYKKLEKPNSGLISKSYLYRYRNTLRDPMTINTLIRILKYRDTREGIVLRWSDNLDQFGYSRYAVSSETLKEKGWDVEAIGDYSFKKTTIDRNELRYLLEIKKSAASNNVNLIIGTVPLPFFDLDFRNYIQSLALELGVDFIQGNNATGESRYFSDTVHLNLDGAKLFSEYLAQELAHTELN